LQGGAESELGNKGLYWSSPEKRERCSSGTIGLEQLAAVFFSLNLNFSHVITIIFSSLFVCLEICLL